MKATFIEVGGESSSATIWVSTEAQHFGRFDCSSTPLYFHFSDSLILRVVEAMTWEWSFASTTPDDLNVEVNRDEDTGSVDSFIASWHTDAEWMVVSESGESIELIAHLDYDLKLEPSGTLWQEKVYDTAVFRQGKETFSAEEGETWFFVQPRKLFSTPSAGFYQEGAGKAKL